MFLINGYGMTESSAPETLSNPKNFKKFDENCMKSTGAPTPGTEILIYKPD